MDDKMDASARLEAIQKLKELMKQLELEQFAPKSSKLDSLEGPDANEASEQNEELDDKELEEILGR